MVGARQVRPPRRRSNVHGPRSPDSRARRRRQPGMFAGGIGQVLLPTQVAHVARRQQGSHVLAAGQAQVAPQMVGAQAGAREHAADQRVVVSSSGALQVSSSTRNSSENRAADRPGRAPHRPGAAVAALPAPRWCRPARRGTGSRAARAVAGGRPLRPGSPSARHLPSTVAKNAASGSSGCVAQQSAGQQAGGLVGDQGVIHEGRLRKREAERRILKVPINRYVAEYITNRSGVAGPGGVIRPVARTRPACRRPAAGTAANRRACPGARRVRPCA